MHSPLHLKTKYDQFTTPNSKNNNNNNNNNKSLPAYFVLENMHHHFVTDETDLKVTGQSSLFVCCLITKPFSFILQNKILLKVVI